MNTKLAIAVEPKKGGTPQGNYRIWYLQTNSLGDVVQIGTMSKEELVNDIFENYKNSGETYWRAFLKDSTQSRPIEVFDFIAKGIFENTHFGNLPTLQEFQKVLDYLKTNLEIRSIA
jgi:hypothetical protein